MLRRNFLLAALSAAAFGSVRRASAAPSFAPTSLLYVSDIDPIAFQATGRSIVGSPAFGERKGYEYRYFASLANHDAYRKGSGSYPDVGPSTVCTFGGADIVERYSNGVRDPSLGDLIAGRPEFAHWHNYGIFRFVSAENRARFIENPDKFVPPCGIYCVGAMARGGITPGDPQWTVYLWPAGMWAVFGSRNGLAWAAMSSGLVAVGFKKAEANYNERIGRSSAGKVAG